MATAVKFWNRLFSSSEVGEEQEQQLPAAPDAATRVRVFANEDVLFYVKAIDNARVVPKADPAERGRCWKMFGSVVGAVVVLIAVLLPGAYWLHAGYQVETLREETQRLAEERTALEVQLAKLTSPARMESLARAKQFAEPLPSSIVYLSGRQGSLAMNKQQ